MKLARKVFSEQTMIEPSRLALVSRFPARDSSATSMAMLAGLSIRDFVLVDRLDLAFASGLSALTGETGAGKSILLDALGLVPPDGCCRLLGLLPAPHGGSMRHTAANV